MFLRFQVLGVLAVVGLVAASACSKKSPVQPTAQAAAPSGAEALTASVGAPRPFTPANGAPIRNVDQPVTLVVTNGFSTKGGGELHV